MNKFLLCPAILVLALAGCAGPAPKTPERADIGPPSCVRDTGSRIEHAGCNGQPGRSYSQEDLQRTGALDPGEALRKLDPSVRGR